MTPSDWLLIVVESANGAPLQPVQLQKSLFLLSKNLSNDQLHTTNFYHFMPYDYGPFCSDVYSDAEALEVQHLLTIAKPPMTRYKQYSITQAGSHRATELQQGVSDDVLGFVRDIVGFTRRLSFNQLVSAIYRVYPEMKEKSIFKE